MLEGEIGPHLGSGTLSDEKVAEQILWSGASGRRVEIVRMALDGIDWPREPSVRRCARRIELDGGQHLADANAYRRDPRKDHLLQENDYVILRFLAEDVGKELDLVLDTILRTLIRRTPFRSRPKIITLLPSPKQ